MEIPNNIRIGETDYKIKVVRVVDWKNSAVVGQINYSSKLMKLKDFKDNKRIVEDNFFHEISHGLLKELEYNHPRIMRFRNNEEFIQEMGLTLRKLFLELLSKQKVK